MGGALRLGVVVLVALLATTTPGLTKPDPGACRGLTGRTLKIGSIEVRQAEEEATLHIHKIFSQSEPFLRRVSEDTSLGNDQFEGYIKDLVTEVAKDCNFNFR